MSATIYHLRDHDRARDRVRRSSPALRGAPARRNRIVDSRSGLGFMVGILAYVAALVTIGVWLTTEIAAVGRTNNRCLSNARLACGPLQSEHAHGGSSNLVY
jgi:hypothetical protein